MSRSLICLAFIFSLYSTNLWAVDLAVDRAVDLNKAQSTGLPKVAEVVHDPDKEQSPDDLSEADKQESDKESKSDKKKKNRNKKNRNKKKKAEKQEETDDSADKDSSEEAETKKAESKQEDQEEEQEKPAKPKEKKQAEKKPEPFKVEPKPLKIEVELAGLFVAEETEEVSLRPEVWPTFKVVEAVEHGTHVKKGDVLIRFDEEKFDERLAKESLAQRLEELALMKEEEAFPRLEKALEYSYTAAKRALEKLEEDIAYYESTNRPFTKRIAHFLFKNAKESLASQREELDQLKKMYEADDLTEETEAIVLRRQRFHVERAELVMELETAGRDYSLDVIIPRRNESYAVALKETKLTFEQAKSAKELGMTRARYDLEKLRASRALSIQKHSKLVGDRGLLVIRSPADGVVYYGKCVKGKWSQVTSLKAKLLPFGSVTANSVLMTIVQQRPLRIETSVSEKQLPDFSQRMAAIITPTGDDELEFQGKVSEIQPVPDGSKKFAMQLTVDTSEAPEWLVAGMTCKAKVTTYENEEALLIPSDMVQTDEDNDKRKYVLLVDPEEDEPVRRKVKLGRSKDKMVEVLKGLEEDDEIVKPEKKE